ncbi:type II secretion system GspH family protein [Enterobacter cloacae]|uniref:type II secretion system protein n=1 Tax=Enterobacter cloacae TaxID=550 RepID=UPI0034A1204C
MLAGKSNESGFTYLLLIIWLAIVAIMLLCSEEHIAANWRRQKEAQLLFTGDQIRKAILDYRDNPQSDTCFPVSFQQLSEDKRGGRTRYLLRRHYLDPFTGKEWGKLYDKENRWIGVYSKGEGIPLKRKRFPAHYEEFEKAKSYADWKFIVEEDPAAPHPDHCRTE